MAWLPDGEKMLMIRLFVLAWSTNVTDTRTDRRIDTTWWHRPRLHSIARQTAKIIWILLVLVLHWAVDVIEVTLNVVTVFLSNLLVWCPKFYSCSSSLHYVYYPWQYPYFISVFEPSTSCWWHTNFLLLSEWSWLKHYSPDWCQRNNAVSETLRYEKSICVKTTTQGHQRSLMILPIVYYLENIKHRIRKSKHTGTLLWSLRHIVTISFCHNLHSTSTYGTWQPVNYFFSSAQIKYITSSQNIPPKPSK